MGASDEAELIRLVDAGESHKLVKIVPVSAAGVRITEIGEPFDLRGDGGQPVKRLIGQNTRGGRNQFLLIHPGNPFVRQERKK